MFFHNKHTRKTLLIQSTVFVIIGALIVFVLAVVGLYITNAGDKAVQGVFINDTPAHNLTKQQAQQLLEQRLDALLQQDTTFYINNATRTASLASTGVYVDIDATLNRVYDYGKKGALYSKLYEQIQSLFGKKTFPLVVSFNQQIFDSYIENTFQGLYTLPQNAQLRYSVEQERFQIIDPVQGIIIDEQTLQNSIARNLQSFTAEPIRVEHLSQAPLAIQRPQHLIEQAQVIINRDLEISVRGDVAIQVPQQTLASWAVFTHQKNDTLSVEYPSQPIQTYLETVAEKYDVEPKNARFTIRNDSIQIRQKSANGYTIQIPEGVATIQTALQNGQNKATIPTKTIPASVNENNVYNLNFTLLGTGKTSYAGSSSNRTHNIGVGASRYQGVVINPGSRIFVQRKPWTNQRGNRIPSRVGYKKQRNNSRIRRWAVSGIHNHF